MLVWSVFIHLSKCLILLLVFFLHLYFTRYCRDTFLRYDGIYNNHIIANCQQSVLVREFWKSVNNWQRYGQKSSATFYGPRCSICPWLQDQQCTLAAGPGFPASYNLRRRNRQTPVRLLITVLLQLLLVAVVVVVVVVVVVDRQTSAATYLVPNF